MIGKRLSDAGSSTTVCGAPKRSSVERPKQAQLDARRRAWRDAHEPAGRGLDLAPVALARARSAPASECSTSGRVERHALLELHGARSGGRARSSSSPSRCGAAIRRLGVRARPARRRGHGIVARGSGRRPRAASSELTPAPASASGAERASSAEPVLRGRGEGGASSRSGPRARARSWRAVSAIGRERRVRPEVGDAPAVPAQREPEADQPEVVLVARQRTRAAPAASPPLPQPRASPSSRPRSSELAKCSWAIDTSPRSQRSPSSCR